MVTSNKPVHASKIEVMFYRKSVIFSKSEQKTKAMVIV